MEEIKGKEIMEMAELAARGWSKKMGGVHRDVYQDIKSEAAITILKCKKTFNPEKGVKFKSYAMSAVNRRIGIFLCHVNSPVSAPDSFKYLSVLVAATRARVPLSSVRGDNQHSHTLCRDNKQRDNKLNRTMRKRINIWYKASAAPDPASKAENYINAKRLMERMKQIGLDPKENPIARIALGLSGVKEVSLETGEEPKDIYKKVRKARVKLSKDYIIKRYIK